MMRAVDAARARRQADQPAEEKTQTISGAFLRFCTLGIASYGTLYFSYKWYAAHDPDFLLHYARNDLSPLNFAHNSTPHILRQGSAIVTWLIYHLGLYYPDSIAFSAASVDQRLFFAALVGNYIGLLIAATFAGSIASKQDHGGSAAAVLAGLLCIGSFAAQSFVITGNTEGVTWAMVAALFYLAARESRVLFAVVLLASILQREMIAVLFGAFAIFSFYFEPARRRYWMFVLASSIFCLAAYVALREIVIPGDQEQLSPSWIAGNVAAIRMDRTTIFQGLVSQNLIVLVLVLAALARAQGLRSPPALPQLLLTFVVLVVVSLVEGEMAGDIGRIGAMLTPALASSAAASLMRINASDEQADQQA